MKKLILALSLILLASPALAGIKNCTAALIAANACQQQDAQDALIIVEPDALMDVAITDAVVKGGWTSTVLCTDELVADSGCTAQQIGTQVPWACTASRVASHFCKPGQLGQAIGRQQFAFMYFRDEFNREHIMSRTAEGLHAASRAKLAADLAAIAYPDSGD